MADRLSGKLYHDHSGGTTIVGARFRPTTCLTLSMICATFFLSSGSIRPVTQRSIAQVSKSEALVGIAHGESAAERDASQHPSVAASTAPTRRHWYWTGKILCVTR